jgi:hypothetical protein
VQAVLLETVDRFLCRARSFKPGAEHRIRRFVGLSGDGVRYDIFVIPRIGAELRQITHDRNMIRGLAWLPDGKGIVYGSSRGNTLPYLPALALWQVPLEGGVPRQITPIDGWYEQPDVSSTGSVSAARVRIAPSRLSRRKGEPVSSSVSGSWMPMGAIFETSRSAVWPSRGHPTASGVLR